MSKKNVGDHKTASLRQLLTISHSAGIPADPIFHAQLGEGEQRWSTYPPIIDDLKAKARKLGLWNMFLPKSHHEGAGFSNLEYGLMAEYLGKSRTGSEVWL